MIIGEMIWMKVNKLISQNLFLCPSIKFLTKKNDGVNNIPI